MIAFQKRKSNIVQVFATQPRSLDAEILRYADSIGALFHELAAEALQRIREAESDSVRRLNEFSPTERTLSLEEAAAYVGLSPRALKDGTRPGRIPPIFSFVVVAGKKRFRLSSLDRDLAAREVNRPEVKL